MKTVRAVVMASALAAGALAVTAPSAAAAGGGVDDQVSGSSGAGGIAVEVHFSGTAVTNGGVTSSGGHTTAGTTATTYTPPACMWDSLGGAYTGKTMWERYQDEETLNHQAAVGGEEAMYLPVKKAVEAHKDDQGVWYTVAPGPRSTIGDDHWWDDVTSTCIGKLRQAAPPGINGGNAGYIFVPAGTNPPQPLPQPPSVEVLRDLALRALTLPVPQIGQNPTTRTLVRLPTWFWTDGGDFREWSITATAGEPANSATVTATPAEFFVAGGGQRRECSVPAGTTAWHQGAANTSGCTLEFERASIEGPYRVTGTTSYGAAWTSTIAGAAGPGGPLADPQVRDGVTQIPVAEVQSIVTSGS
ncbi:hypothetical protein [Angustibacter aerolatus]